MSVIEKEDYNIIALQEAQKLLHGAETILRKRPPTFRRHSPQAIQRAYLNVTAAIAVLNLMVCPFDPPFTRSPKSNINERK